MRLTFGNKIIVLSASLVALGLMALVATVVQMEYRYLASEARQEALFHLKTFARACEDLQRLPGGAPIHRRLSTPVGEILKEPAVVYLAFQDEDGNLLYSSQMAPDVTPLVHRTALDPRERRILKAAGLWTRPATLPGREPVTEILQTLKGGGMVRLGLREGQVRIALHRFTRDALIRLFVINGCAVLGALCCVIFFARSIERPIREARGKLARLLEGRADRSLPGRRADDLTLLAGEVDAIRALIQRLEAKPAELVGTLSHEVLSPLQSIVGNVDLLKSGRTGPVTKEMLACLQSIQESVALFESFARGSLDLVRLEKGKLQLDRAPFAVDAVAREVLRFFLPEAKRHKLRLRARVARDLRAFGDKERTHQVLVNLVANALKFTPEGGEISLSARMENGHVGIEVADTGVGLSPEQCERVFERFYQGSDQQRLRGSQGVGLGLSLAKALVEAQGGRIWMESAIGQGTRVHFTLPRAQAAS